MKSLLVVILLFVSLVGKGQNESPVKIKVEKHMEINDRNSLIGTWSLLNVKGNFDHLISFNADGTFKIYGSLETKFNFTGTWKSEKDSLTLQIVQLENIKLDYQVILKNQNSIRLISDVYGKHPYFDNNHLELKSANLTR